LSKTKPTQMVLSALVKIRSEDMEEERRIL